MQLCFSKLVCVALFVGALALTEAGLGDKIHNCCTKVSTSRITAPIIGYRIQRKNLPCVRAVIFQTTEGEVCSHWREEWVFEKMKELELLRKMNKNTTLPTTTSPESTSASSGIPSTMS